MLQLRNFQLYATRENHILSLVRPKAENFIPLEIRFKVPNFLEDTFPIFQSKVIQTSAKTCYFFETGQEQFWFSVVFGNSKKFKKIELAYEIHNIERNSSKVSNTTNRIQFVFSNTKIQQFKKTDFATCSMDFQLCSFDTVLKSGHS